MHIFDIMYTDGHIVYNIKRVHLTLVGQVFSVWVKSTILTRKVFFFTFDPLTKFEVNLRIVLLVKLI